MAILRADNILRKFDNGGQVVFAVNNMSLKIQPADITFLMGRSGSGKTTLINILSGLDKPDSGNTYFNDIDLSLLSEKKKELIRCKEFGFVFQSVALISNMTAYENVEFALRISRTRSDVRAERAKECLELVGLEKRMKHLAYELSGGEQQRVAIARAIAHRPKVIFADEPTAELDSTSGKSIMNLFRDLADNHEITFVISTHDTTITEFADKIYTLEDGEITNEI